ncbi:MAG: 30S ribosomal protein S4 [Armatimonadetes bacterium]|nr:30S ribosomal protein S4 [Armatimonadota bacterium]
MAVYSGPVCRLCRRDGVKLFLKGERCYTSKCAIEKRKGSAPGQHGARPRKLAEYGVQLREKQKLKRIYRVLERPFRNYFKEAVRRKGVTGELLLQQLELRLDNVVYRLGFGLSRRQARQLVNHEHFRVNGRKVNVPSYQLRPGDVVTVADGSRQVGALVEAIQSTGGRRCPEWLSLDLGAMSGKVLAAPTREQIDTQVNEALIVEFYSR